MALGIGSQVVSLGAQRRLNATSEAAATSMSRLGSGLRINKASDDAAGLAIATELSSSRKIYAQAIRNINDGISMLTIADAAAENLSVIVTRIQELAEQSANGTFGIEQRKALHAEARALTDEYNRIRSTTTFNGIDVVKGLSDGVLIQAGVGQDESLGIRLSTAQGPAWMSAVAKVSTTTSGGEANGLSGNSALSYDGRYMVFNSNATNLVAGDTNATDDIFKKDLLTGEVTRVSTSSTAGESSGSSLTAAISSDGRYVAFQSVATNLVAGDTNGTSDLRERSLHGQYSQSEHAE